MACPDCSLNEYYNSCVFFVDMLYVTPVKEGSEYLPSPADLVGKILVKVCSNLLFVVCLFGGIHLTQLYIYIPDS